MECQTATHIAISLDTYVPSLCEFTELMDLLGNLITM